MLCAVSAQCSTRAEHDSRFHEPALFFEPDYDSSIHFEDFEDDAIESKVVPTNSSRARERRRRRKTRRDATSRHARHLRKKLLAEERIADLLEAMAAPAPHGAAGHAYSAEPQPASAERSRHELQENNFGVTARRKSVPC